MKKIIDDLEIELKIENNKLSISATNAPGSSIANDAVDVHFDIDLEDIARLIEIKKEDDSDPFATQWF